MGFEFLKQADFLVALIGVVFDHVHAGAEDKKKHLARFGNTRQTSFFLINSQGRR